MVFPSSSVVSITKKTTILKTLRALHDASSDNLRIVVCANNLLEDSTQKRLI